MPMKPSRRAQTKIRTPIDLQHAVDKISVQMKGDTIFGVQLFGVRVKESFQDSFKQGPEWKDTFVDGGQFLSNFNNLGRRVLVQHPAIRFALKRFQKAAKTRK